MISLIVICVLAVALVGALVALFVATRQAKRVEVSGERLTAGDVEAIAMRRCDDADVVKLAMDWREMRDSYERQIALQELEITDALSRLPPARGVVLSGGGDA